MALKLWQLFVAMLKAGGLSWGGAQGLIPFMYADCVQRYGWLTDEHFSELVAVDSALPGIFAVKLAAMIGWEVAGPAGFVASVLGLSLPGILLFMGLFQIIQAHRDTKWLLSMLNGLQYGAAGLIAFATLKVLPAEADRGSARAFAMGLGLMVLVFVSLKFKWVSPAVAMLGSGAFGILLWL